jgi:hypothetical protein
MTDLEFADRVVDLVETCNDIPPVVKKLMTITKKGDGDNINGKSDAILNLHKNYSLRLLRFGDYSFLEKIDYIRDRYFVFAKSSHSYLCIDKDGTIVDVDRLEKTELYDVAKSQEFFLDALYVILRHQISKYCNVHQDNQNSSAREVANRAANKAGGERFFDFYFSLVAD